MDADEQYECDCACGDALPLVGGDGVVEVEEAAGVLFADGVEVFDVLFVAEHVNELLFGEVGALGCGFFYEGG